MIDLSMPLHHLEEGVTITRRPDPPVYVGHECFAWDLAIPSHTGTYFETSGHVFRDGINTNEFPVEDLVLPAVCLRIDGAGREISAAELEQASEAVGLAPDSRRRALLVDAGSRIGEEHAYFSRDAADWLADRGVRVFGSNTPRYDTGFVDPTGFFIDLFAAKVAIVANIVNLHLIPDCGFKLAVFPLSVAGVATVPCRVVAMSYDSSISTDGFGKEFR